MELKGRLKLIASMVPKCNVVCDIGTDHAYVPLYLVMNDVCRKAVASDVRNGPVTSAKDNIARFKLEDQIDARLGDGLSTISESEADVIIVAGMGGELISRILAEGFVKARNASALVLQPMNSPEILRKWLLDNGFEIYGEQLAGEGDKIYVVISARWKGGSIQAEKIKYFIGEKLIQKKDPLLKPYITKKLTQLEKAIHEIKNSSENNNDILEEYVWMKVELEKILVGLSQ